MSVVTNGHNHTMTLVEPQGSLELFCLKAAKACARSLFSFSGKIQKPDGNFGQRSDGALSSPLHPSGPHRHHFYDSCLGEENSNSRGVWIKLFKFFHCSQTINEGVNQIFIFIVGEL